MATTSTPTDDQLIAGARAYVDALQSHDPTAVPLDPRCTRIELGVKTGRNGGHIAQGLKNAPQFKLIHTIADFRAEVIDGVVHTTFYVHVHPRPLRLRAKVTESFEFTEAGQIIRIVARFGLPHRG